MELNPITIQYYGEHAINIIFIAEGFQESEQDAFHLKVDAAVESFFSYEPYKYFREAFNIYSIPTVSVDSGVSTISHPNNPTTPIVKDTFLKAFFNSNGFARLLGFEKTEELELALVKLFKNKVYPILICNSPLYGGAGNFPEDNFMSWTIVTMETQYNQFGKLLLHEFGHSFGGLADEYGGNCTTNRPARWDEVLYDRPNVTKDIVNDRKWDFLENPVYIEGANYCNTGWWRSSNYSLMRGWFQTGTIEDEDFNILSKILIQRRIGEELEMNRKTLTLTGGIINTRFSDKRKNSDKLKYNLRINGDVNIRRSYICDNLWVNKGSKLVIERGVTVRYKNLINKGEIVNLGNLIQV